MHHDEASYTLQLKQAVANAVKQELRSSGWPVYERYEIVEEDGDIFVVAPLTPESFVEWTEEASGYRKGHLRDPIEDAMTFYAPLRAPELVVELAGLADKEITPEDVLDWAHIYGVLGLPGDDVVRLQDAPITGHVAGWGRRDSVAHFAAAAKEIGTCLRIYEAATADQAPDLEKLSRAAGALPVRILRSWERRTGEERPWLFGVIARMVQARLQEHCFLQLTTFIRSGNPSGRFGFGPGFENLFGAVWIQMAWLLDSENVKRCKRPDCGRVISFEPGEPAVGTERNLRGRYKTRSDKTYCNVNCRVKYNQRKKAGRPGYT